MKRACSLTVALVTVLIAGSDASAKLRVVATVPDLAAIARSIGGTQVEVTSLSTANQDPHFVDARPHLMLSLNRADLLVTVGLQLEVGWLPVLLTGARNSKVQPGNEGFLDCSTVVALRQVPKVRLDRSMGDIHPGGNPHYLIDPDNAVRVGRAIAKRMARLDPAHAEGYKTNADQFSAAVQVAWKRWRAQVKPFAGAPFVGFHNGWVYFAEAFGLRVVGYLEPKPGIPPSAKHLLQLIRRMRSEHVSLILCRSYYPDSATRLVAQKAGATLVRVAGGANLRQGESYVQRIDRLVQQVAGALGARQRERG